MITIIPYEDKFKEDTKHLILDILYNEFHVQKRDRPDLDRISDIYQIDKSNFWIALDVNKVVGTIALANYGKRRGYLKRMYLKKEYRGTGLAKKLLETLLIFAKNNNYKEIYLGTNDFMIAANKFYQKNNFVKINSLPKDIPSMGDTIFYKLEL